MPIPIVLLQEWEDLTSTHSAKTAAHGLPVLVVMVPLILYSDDLSRNRSKKWNKFDEWSFMLTGLPKELNAKLENIHFIGSSNRVSALDICPPIVEDLFRLETEGIVTYDAHLREDVLAVAPVLCVLCDNPRASEINNH